jgi:Tfp pilus assembly PilM family ATPase
MLFAKQKSQLGIDIGTSNIKLVELKPTIQVLYWIHTVSQMFHYNLSGKDSKSAIEQTATVVKELMKRSGVTTNKAVASFPTMSSSLQ